MFIISYRKLKYDDCFHSIDESFHVYIITNPRMSPASIAYIIMNQLKHFSQELLAISLLWMRLGVINTIQAPKTTAVNPRIL